MVQLYNTGKALTSEDYYNEKKILYLNDDSFCLLNEDVSAWPFEETNFDPRLSTIHSMELNKRKHVLTPYKVFNLTQLVGLSHENNDLPAVELIFGS